MEYFAVTWLLTLAAIQIFDKHGISIKELAFGLLIGLIGLCIF